ncbi:restin homolog isoform X1 [Cucurbita moschata]|uniref:Restin homolog isoform X1 n=1 Tax=Cucurbita moschata TaxID=3662 RepID=A0A6J1GRR8_CUCMO|nr:restin homolog isoform X1 [Cucurbita moschata]XP_022954740.1 restin homolog isoform X1 [Cucurbita moschata]XP_022954741.1 restin homolog isoform X1 [Cucurbita moschata]XP_022954742.1 restin homolog isoform X1 [Cucurbita moschata]XP_022954743.1 restin homolog isoform X1 [Cucurbita moschata]
MLDDFVPNPESANSCCKRWKDKCTEVEEKRNALRQAVKLLQQQINKIQAENLNLKKGYEEDKAGASIEREGKEKESAIRVSLEREILDLKSHISSLRQNDVDAVEVCREVEQLNALVAEGKKEISHLNELLETEKRKTDAERKNAEVRKEEAAQALKTVRIERSKASDLRKLHKNELDKVKECRQQLEMLKKEYEETKLKLASETSKLNEVKKDLEIEKRRTSKERERANSEMSKAHVSRIQAEANRKQAEEEQSKAENLLQQLDRKTCKIEELQKQVKELQTLKTFIESCCGQHDEKTDGKAVEKNVKPWLEVIQKNANEFKLAFEFLKDKEVNIMHKMDGDLAIMKEKPLDSNMMKSSELKKHLEIYRKKAMDEQYRADKLALELEEKKRKVEKLQKNLRELKSSRKLVDASAVSFEHAMSSERAEMKLLKKKLKFEKTRLKHAREVANLENTHRSIIQHELGSFKLKFVQLSNYLDNLHKFASTGAKGNDDLEKTKNAENLRSLYAEKNLHAIEPFKTWLPDTFRQTTPQHDAPLLPLSGGNHVTSLSGIESRLEAHPVNSDRKMFQSCAVNSSTASFSDGQLAGSREKAGLCLTAAKLVGENLIMKPKISNVSGEVSEMKDNENARMAENSVRSPIKNHVGRANEKQQKRKRTIEAVENIECLYHESRKIHSQIEEKLSLLHALNSPTEKPLDKSGHVISNVFQDPSADKKARKKRKTLCQKKTREQLLDDNEMELSKVNIEVCALESFGRQPSQPVSKLTDNLQPCLEELNNSAISELQTLGTLGNISDGDYMKLLDLDSAADEECYRRAMEMPLSPSLPDIYIPGAETSTLNEFEPLLDERHEEGQPQLHSYDVMDVEIKSNHTQYCNSGLLGDIHSSKHHLDPCFMQGSHGSDLCDIVQAKENYLNQIGVTVEMPGTNVPLSGCEGVGASEIKSGTLDNSIPDFCVLFSNIKDCRSISRIFSATRACSKRSSLTNKKEWMVQEILASLNMEHKLLPMEKACVFFSLLLLNFNVVAVHKYGNFLNCNTCLDSFSGHICEAMLDVEIRSLFTESLCLDELLSLIEDFIIDGRILSCIDASLETSIEGVLRVNISVDGVNRALSLTPASTNYLIAGSSILASISKAVDRTGFLWEVSYSILRICRYESSLVLTMLHIFAHIGGDQFFSLEGYSTLMAVLKSIITHLEVVGSSDDASFTPPKGNCRTEFVQCAHCPFSANIMSMPMAVSFLLRLVHKNALAEDLENPTGSLNPESLSEKNIAYQIPCKNLSGQEVHPALYLDCDASCCLKKYRVSDDESWSLFNPSLCEITDAISLVELLACYMGWNWTFANIISQLLEFLKSSVKESLPFVILLGQLGRFGVAAGGFEDGGVKILRSNLSAFLYLDTTIKSGLCVQIAIVSALLGLLPFEFETIIQDKVSYPASSNPYVEVNLIKTWFSFLSPKQKELSCNTLQVAVCSVS